MKKRRIKGFLFDAEADKEIIEHIEKQPNQSKYIKDLAEKDMNSESLEEIVRKEIKKILKEG